MDSNTITAYRNEAIMITASGNSNGSDPLHSLGGTPTPCVHICICTDLVPGAGLRLRPSMHMLPVHVHASKAHDVLSTPTRYLFYSNYKW